MSCARSTSAVSDISVEADGADTAEQAVASLAQGGGMEAPKSGYVSTGDEGAEQRVFAHVVGNKTTATVTVAHLQNGWFVTGLTWCR